MTILENISLKKLNTFSIEVTARYFATFANMYDLAELLEFSQRQTLNSDAQTLILGGGSNILFTNNYDGLVLKNEMRGIELVGEDEEYVFVKVAAGENWHQFVLNCINNNWAGVENLSLIPGNVGASPMQNIGAYGVEIKDVFHCLEAYHKNDKATVIFTLTDCKFGYRESVFKTNCKNQFVITSVTFKLRKQPIFNTSYGAIEEELEHMKVQQLSIKSISDAVIKIRSSKLPNPAEIGNAGSFFKNPEIANVQFEKLKSSYPNIVGYSLPNGNVKLAAGWLIEQCGPDSKNTSWKGYRAGDAGCHAYQALVLVNYGKATGTGILKLSDRILQSVKNKFDVSLEREVNII